MTAKDGRKAASATKAPPPLPSTTPPQPPMQTATYVVPDGGYGWVIVGCSFVFICLPMGIGSTFGLYYEEWLEHFGAGKVATSLVGSISAGCIPVLGALAGMVLTNLFDTRIVGIIGCIVSGFAMLLASYANSIAVLALTYGALGGLGLGLMFNSAYLVVAAYFDKKRPAATAIASSGTGFGTLFALMLRYFIQEYGWRGSLILLGGVCIQGIVFGALMRPLHTQQPSDHGGCRKPDKALPPQPPLSSSHGGQNGGGSAGKIDSAAVAAAKPSVDSITRRSAGFRGSSLARVRKDLANEQQQQQALGSSRTMHGIGTAAASTTAAELERDAHLYGSCVYGMSEFSSVLSVSRVVPLATARVPTADGRTFASVATIETIQKDAAGRCAQIRQSFRRSFSLEVMRNRYFVLVTLGLTLHHMAFFIPYTYVISLARGHSIDRNAASYLILTFGLANFVLKLAIGLLTMVYKQIDQLHVVCVSLAASAAAAAVTTFCTVYWQFVVMAIIYGGMSPIVTIYVTSLLVKYMGADKLASSFSMATLVRGFGTIAGPPLAGKVIEFTGMTEAAFYFGTAADVLSLICFVTIIVVDRRDPKFIAKRAADAAAAAKAAAAAAAESRHHQRAQLPLPQIIVTCPTVDNLHTMALKEDAAQAVP